MKTDGGAVPASQSRLYVRSATPISAVASDIASVSGATTADADARQCVRALLASLGDRQRELVRGDLADPDLRRWTDLPGDRSGLSRPVMLPPIRRFQ